jgi:hypothetical protein
LLSSGLGGHFQNLGSRSRGGGSALFRIGYEYLYAKGAFGFSIILIPHMTLDFGNLGRPTRDITMALNAGIGLQIGFFAYSSQTPK